MKSIFKREFKSYFTSMVGPLFIAVMVFITGIYFKAFNLNYGWPYFSYTLGSVLFVFVITVPVLTMRSFSEERKTKTDQLLLTSPATVGQIVLGKYLSMIAVTAIPCLIYCICPLIIKSYGTAFFTVDYLSLFVFFLIGCVYVSIGMLISSMTESVIISAVGTIAALLLCTLMSGIASLVPSTASASFAGCVIILTLAVIIIYIMTKNFILCTGIEFAGLMALFACYIVKSSLFENLMPKFLEALAFADIYDRFASDYILDIKGIIELVSIAAVCVFLTTQVIQKRRWS